MSPRRVGALFASVAVALGFGLVGTAAAAAVPANDLIGHATVVSSLPFSGTVDTTAATTDANDTQVNTTCGAPATNNSVWYKLTAAGAMNLSVDTSGSTYTAGIIIATGTAGALTTQTCGLASATLSIAAGKTYFIMAFDFIGSGGTLQISIHGPSPAPANDKIAHAAAVSSLPFHATLDTTSATTDAVDTQANKSCGAPATGNSVWYKLTAGTSARNVFVDASTSDYDVGVLIAQGTPGALTTVSCGPLLVTAKLTAGTQYYVMIFDAFDGGGGHLRLDIGNAPGVALSVHGRASLDDHGVVHVTGGYTCSNARSLDIAGELVEIVGNNVSTGNYDTLGVPAPVCNGKAQPWTGLALPSTTSFAPGQTAAFTDANACNLVVCTVVSKTSVVLVTSGSGAKSGAATTVSVHTKTVHRFVGPTFGNAVHATTASWGH